VFIQRRFILTPAGMDVELHRITVGAIKSHADGNPFSTSINQVLFQSQFRVGSTDKLSKNQFSIG